ncbi:hypothetical protein H310_03877 [Aphanomyces invadans]|uniref:glucan endo-1,3-beta-D-glucosidase n=1 Tax=Aphanomyces invadans TaxID=157072 RepID=A0A024UGF6_9STRA|nr:hypothetical protein H310_03877 [Aphanomyces invadans]ETW04728.1 hypothetical protein H310_03877 [Aphanomyces invadans]|eukprot:XP_008866166.1 hypothetical protein H310_03877 [Aphanomyces invadans]
MKAACIALAALATAAHALDVKLSGINYNPRKGADWDADDARCKSVDEVRADMKLLAAITSNIRLYSMTDCNQMEIVVPAAKEAGLTVWAGMWIGKDGAGFESEKAKLSSLIEKKIIDSSVVGLHVGSETVYRQDLTPKQAIEYMQDVKKLIVQAGLKFPVTIADIGDSYMWYPELAAAVDIISINQFPFWEGRPVDGAIQFMADRVAPLVKLAKENNKQIMVGETGWATAGKAKAAGEASPENAAAWLNDFHVFATEQQWRYYYFTSFDTPWKHNADDPNSEAEVENHFGLFDSTRQLKPCYANLNVKKRVVIIKDDGSKPTTTPFNAKPKTDTLLNTTTSSSTKPVATAKPGSPTTTSSSAAGSTRATMTPAPSSSPSTVVPSNLAGTATSAATASTLVSMAVLVASMAALAM